MIEGLDSILQVVFGYLWVSFIHPKEITKCKHYGVIIGEQELNFPWEVYCFESFILVLKLIGF